MIRDSIVVICLCLYISKEHDLKSDRMTFLFIWYCDRADIALNRLNSRLRLPNVARTIIVAFRQMLTYDTLVNCEQRRNKKKS